jgi:hypothetical protein
LRALAKAHSCSSQTRNTPYCTRQCKYGLATAVAMYSLGELDKLGPNPSTQIVTHQNEKYAVVYLHLACNFALLFVLQAPPDTPLILLILFRGPKTVQGELRTHVCFV